MVSLLLSFLLPLICFVWVFLIRKHVVNLSSSITEIQWFWLGHLGVDLNEYYEVYKPTENLVKNVCCISLYYTWSLIKHFTTNFSLNVVGLSKYNTNMYKFYKQCKAIFSIFYNITQPNFAILLVLRCFF